MIVISDFYSEITITDEGIVIAMKFDQLIAMKKTRKAPTEGDIFVLQPLSNIFYFGKVIQTNLVSKDSFINGMTLIYIYDNCSQNKEIPENLENSIFLVPPIIVNNQPWQRGYFETICNTAVLEKEKKINYGFWDVLKKEFVDVSGKRLRSEPAWWSIYGLGSYGIVGKEVQKAIRKKDKI